MGIAHLLRRVRSAGVEPIVFVYGLALFMLHLTQSQYLYVRISEDKGFPYWSMASSGGGGCKVTNGSTGVGRGNSSLKELEIEVQTAASRLLLYYVMSYTPMLVVLPFWGSYSDRVGRKVGLVASLVSFTIEAVILLLIMYFKLPIHLILLSGALQGITGNISTLWLSVSGYLADTVRGDRLSFRFAAVQCTVFISGTVGQLTSGLWIKYLGFRAPIWFVVGCTVTVLLYIIFVLQESRKSLPDAKKRHFFTVNSLKSYGRLLSKYRDGQRKNVLLLLLFTAINFMTMVGSGAVTLLFLLRTPLCWGPQMIGYFNAYKFFVYGVAATISIYLLRKCISELHIARLGYLFDVAGNLMFAFSDRTWMVFLTPVVGLLRTLHPPIFASTLSRIVGPDEQGSLFAVTGQLNAVGKFVGASLFNNLYPISLKMDFPGFVFALAAGIAFIVLLSTSFLDIPPEIMNISRLKKKCDIQGMDTTSEKPAAKNSPAMERVVEEGETTHL